MDFNERNSMELSKRPNIKARGSGNTTTDETRITL